EHVMYRYLLLCVMLWAGVACAPVTDLDDTPEPLGDFRLGFNVVRVAPDAVKGPVSRTATTEDWTVPLQQAFDRRFDRFQGDTYYHLGVTVKGYILAQPGIPVVLSPKSVLIFDLLVIDNGTQKPLHGEPEQITVIESLTGANIVGSGLTKTKEEQIEELAATAARAAERWMRKQPWFFDNVGDTSGQ
ncbi:MAG: hypothetical protein AAF701_05030, partial [Pseudomonadota bacterium]